MSPTYTTQIRNTILDTANLIRATFSWPARADNLPWQKVVVRPVLIRGDRQIQFSYFDAKKNITHNYSGEAFTHKLDELLAWPFRHIHVATQTQNLQIKISKKGKATLHTTKANQNPAPVLEHDRPKRSLLPDDQAHEFLKAIGIMTQAGKIKADMYGKYRQINEFLKIIEHTGELRQFTGAPLWVVDFGCGNAYLTFATYHYLKNTLGLPVHMTGIDVKADLLERHVATAKTLGWEHLAFQAATIANYHTSESPELVIALHACDTATDDALARGIQWQSRFILAAPCCHHHLQAQLDATVCPTPMQPVLRHGILKERLGDILTDTFRALILRIMGYQTEVIQFVDTEHTPKNLMIKAVRATAPGQARFIQEYKDLKSTWGVTPYLEEALGEEFTALLIDRSDKLRPTGEPG